jgi:hypothetical protein
VSAIRYGAWAKDRQTWFLGMSGPGLIAVLAGGLPLLTAVTAKAWWFALAWLPAWVVLVVVMAVPVRGRPAARWLADLAIATTGGVMGWTRWQSKAAAGTATNFAEADLPGVLAGIRTHDGPPSGPQLTRPVLIQDMAARTWAVVARISHPGIGLAETGARDQMAAGLSELLEVAATAELISVLAIQIRTVPDDGEQRASWARRHTLPTAPPLALAVNNQLGSAVVQAGVRHEAFVTLVVPEERIAARAKESGGGVDGRGRVLASVMAEVGARLVGSVGCTEVSWLSSPQLAEVVRTGFAPGERGGLTAAAIARRDGGDGADELPMAAAGPTNAPVPEARCYVHDAWSSVTATVLLPDQGAIMGALAPVFNPGVAGERRCVTTFFEPVNRQKANRQVGREGMSAATAADLRSRLGFQNRAQHRRDADRVAGQDVRLAAGRALVRVAIAAATTVPSAWRVNDFGSSLEADIRGAGFHPLRLDLAQDSGFAAACIPLGVGLPTRRGLL